VDLDTELREVVLKAFMDQEDWLGAVEVLKQGTSWSVMRQFLIDFPQPQLANDALLSLLGAYIKAGLERGEFRQIIDDFKPGKTSVSAIATQIEDENILLRCYAALIRVLARSDRLLDERQDDKFVSGTVFNIVKKHVEGLRAFVSPEEVGAALERAGRMDNALMFYEQVFKGKSWGADRGTQYNAKARWLNCKKKQSELFEKDDKKKSQRLAEAKRMSVEWGIQVPDEKYPLLPSLASHEIDWLINGPAASGEAVEPEKAIEDKKNLENEEIEWTEGGQLQIAPHDNLSWFLPQRNPYEGRIELSCDCGGIKLSTLLLPKKRRMELRDKSNDDLVMVRAAENKVDSDDLKLISDKLNVWSIEAWALNIALVDVVPETTLVDITDNDGRRILCLAL